MPGGLKPAEGPDQSTALAISAWNLCGGMEWSAMPIIFDMLGISDVEHIIYQMSAIRDYLKRGE